MNTPQPKADKTTLFGMPVMVSETVAPNGFWMLNERGAKAITNYDQGRITKDDRDAILGEELIERRAAFGFLR